jgi:hypothetical protein
VTPRGSFFIDRGMGFPAPEQVVQAAWADLPADSPNSVTRNQYTLARLNGRISN